MQDYRPSNDSIRFAEFEFFSHSLELFCNGEKVRLQDQPVRVLGILLEQHGNVVTRDELEKRIWPSEYVDYPQCINNAMKRLREALRDTAEKPRFIETLTRRGYRFFHPIEKISASQNGVRSLVVLPLQNLSGDPEQKYFVDGLTEALINTLAKITALRVVSRTTAMHYEHDPRPLREIVRELGVDAALEGTVLRCGNRVRISVQLVEGKSDINLWAETYDREVRDLLEVHAECARAIASEVRINLTPEDEQRLEPTQPFRPEGHDEYSKARYFWNQLSAEGLRKSLEFFQRTIAKDPEHAGAHAGLADCLARLSWWGIVSPQHGLHKAREAAFRAVELDPMLAEAHASKAYCLMHYDLDCVAAEKEFLRALQLNPGYMSVQHFHPTCLASSGRWDDAIAHIKRILVLDPLSLIVLMTAAVILLYGRRTEESMEYSRRALDLNQNFPSALWTMGLALVEKGECDEGLSLIAKAVANSGGQLVFQSALGYANARAGKSAEARSILSQLCAAASTSYVSPYWLAEIHACLGNTEDAFEYLEKAYAERYSWLIYSKQTPYLDNLHGDPRFDAFLARMRFA